MEVLCMASQRRFYLGWNLNRKDFDKSFNVVRFFFVFNVSLKMPLQPSISFLSSIPKPTFYQSSDPSKTLLKCQLFLDSFPDE